MDLYKAAFRPLLFSGLNADPEWLHQRSLQFLDWLAHPHPSPVQSWMRHRLQQSCCLEHTALKQTLWGLSFRNPIGLAAGFDKDGLAARIWPDLGFGFAELGTVTYHPQPGNPQPRLFRLPVDQAALNRMGFNNQGAVALVERLKTLNRQNSIPIGINLGKSKITPLEAAADDYRESFRLLRQWGDYFVINVSSPNTPGLRSLQATEQLVPIVSALQQENSDKKPLLIKIAPDLEWDAIAAVVELAQSQNIAGLIATNTTIRRDHLKTQILTQTGQPIAQETGGISGAPLRSRSTEVIRFIYQQTQGTLPIIGVGGVFTADDAWEKITAGASLVQVYTGWIYEGPWMVKHILAGILQKLQEQGLLSLSEAVGINA